MLCFGQPSPLRCVLLSPQGLATLRGPHLPRPETLRIPGAGLDDAYKVFILIRFLLHPNQMRRRHLESVSAAPYGRCFASFISSRSLSVRGSWGLPQVAFELGPREVIRPCGERRAHRSGEGCPNQGVGSARLKRRLRPTRRSKSATPAVAVQIMPLQKPAPTISNHKNPARSFCGPGR